MKACLDWLNSYLDAPVTTDEADRLLGAQGFPIENRQQVGDDTMLDVEVTSNRPDCLSHVGLARELAAGTGCKLQLPNCELPTAGQQRVEKITSVVNEDARFCPVYTGRVISGVKVGPSPDWLVRRLESIGLRSVNNVVDVTNFVLLELGQPLHAFDLSRLAGQRIVVRHAGDGEVFAAIDGSRHELRSTMLVIADADRPVAVAGVMGGIDSEVGAETTDILLESAIFDPLSVRRTSRTLKLASDSSFRFERGVDPLGVDLASRRAARLIIELAGGELADGVIRTGADEPAPHLVTMRVERCRKLLGIDIEPRRVVELLAALDLSPRHDESAATVTCTIATHRLDLHREVDLIEEVGRLHGLDNIPVRQRIEIVVHPVQPVIAARQALGRVLTAHGYHETITFSFLSPKIGRPFLSEGDEAVLIDDERRKAEPMLRPSLLPSLLACRKTNQDVGNAQVALYETGSAWVLRDAQIIERPLLVMLLDASDPPDALRTMRGTIEELFDRLVGADGLELAAAGGSWFRDGLEIRCDGEPIGYIGVADRRVQELFDLQLPVVLGEVDLDKLLDRYPPTRSVTALSRLPGVERDLSVIVDEPVTWQTIENHVRATEPALMEQLCFITTYRGKPVPAGRKSVSFRMLFRDPTKTLRHGEVDVQVNAVVDRLTKQVGAEVRT